MSDWPWGTSCISASKTYTTDPDPDTVGGTGQRWQTAYYHITECQQPLQSASWIHCGDQGQFDNVAAKAARG